MDVAAATSTAASVEQSSDAAGELHDVVVAPLPASTAEAFVNGAAAALEKAASELPLARLRALIERGREGYRELVLYLPEKLAQELALHCAQHDLEMGRVVASAIEQHLASLKGEPQRRTDDARTGKRSALSVMLDLTEWVRALWATRAKWAPRRTASAS